ncbi:MAG TPA: hypothetical protein VIJ25_10775 [Methylococcales bacterium]
MKDFVVASDIAYKIELGNEYIRVWSGDTNLYEMSSPYLTEHLFQLQMRQIADTMWIVHPLYAQRKLTRTTPTTFSLDVIPFNDGPFLIRNDLIDYSPTPATMTYGGATAVGSIGTLTCSNDFFDAGHAGSPTQDIVYYGTEVVYYEGDIVYDFGVDGTGALMKLIHKRSTTVSKCTLPKSKYTGVQPLPYVICAPIDVKGDFSYTTHGTWNGTIELQRNENGNMENGVLVWETVKTTVSENDTNIQLSKVEDSDNVQYRAVVTEYDTAGGENNLRADITVNNTTVEGIVRILQVTSATQATCVVIAKLDAANGNLPTSRWAEGCWSYYRGFPASVTFFEDRCIYAGSKAIPILLETA